MAFGDNETQARVDAIFRKYEGRKAAPNEDPVWSPAVAQLCAKIAEHAGREVHLHFHMHPAPDARAAARTGKPIVRPLNARKMARSGVSSPERQCTD